MEKEPKIYTEELVRIICPLKSRIFKEEFERSESWGEDGIKTILLREKNEENK